MMVLLIGMCRLQGNLDMLKAMVKKKKAGERLAKKK